MLARGATKQGDVREASLVPTLRKTDRAGERFARTASMLRMRRARSDNRACLSHKSASTTNFRPHYSVIARQAAVADCFASRGNVAGNHVFGTLPDLDQYSSQVEA